MSDYHDYNENLVFDPKMTWEEFVEKYGDDEYDMFVMRIGENKHLSFWKDGQVVITYSYMGYGSRIILAENRTPEEMEAIIEALRGERG